MGSLKQTISALTASNEQLQSKLADTESRALLTEESLRSELTTQKKLNEVLKRADIEKSAKIEDMRKTLADVQREVDARAAEMEQRLEEKESALAELEAKCRELAMNKSELQERLEAVDKFVGQSPSPSSGSRKSPSAKLSATAAAVERIQQSGQTFTEVVGGCCWRSGNADFSFTSPPPPLKYANYVKMEAEAAQLRAENSQLRTAMQDILNEVQTRSAHYDQIEQSYATLIGETNTLSGKLETAMHERETATRQLGTVQRDKKQLSDDNKWFRQTNKDLSRQLQRLLLEVEELQGRVAPGSQPFEMELEQGVQGVISERLLIFQNIEQLQEK